MKPCTAIGWGIPNTARIESGAVYQVFCVQFADQHGQIYQTKTPELKNQEWPDGVSFNEFLAEFRKKLSPENWTDQPQPTDNAPQPGKAMRK